jgi:hypothetical protein
VSLYISRRHGTAGFGWLTRGIGRFRSGRTIWILIHPDLGTQKQQITPALPWTLAVLPLLLPMPPLPQPPLLLLLLRLLPPLPLLLLPLPPPPPPLLLLLLLAGAGSSGEGQGFDLHRAQGLWVQPAWS